ncbi:MAG TPA: STAS domain-containing protein [Thermoleophilaceae bacterium]|jgi:anti-anti-sigma factor
MSELALIEIEDRGDLIVADVSGEIDLANVGQVRRRLLDAVPNHATGLVADLTDVLHLDSSGVHLLFELARSLQLRQQRLCVVAPPEALGTRVLYITGFHRIVPVTTTVGEAVARLDAEAPAAPA